MTKSHPHDEITRSLVKQFCENIFWLKQIHYICSQLFHDECAHSLMERTAHAFFLDLNKIMVEYFVLEIAKLTDPATSLGRKRENFTVANLIESVEWPTDCVKEIDEPNKTILSFRKYIEPARNRLLAHYDKAAVVSENGLGDFPVGEDKKLLDALEKICNVLHKAAFGKICGHMVPSHSGDVLEFKKVLKMAIAYKNLISISTEDEKMRLWTLFDDTYKAPS